MRHEPDREAETAWELHDIQNHKGQRDHYLNSCPDWTSLSHQVRLTVLMRLAYRTTCTKGHISPAKRSKKNHLAQHAYIRTYLT